jgi:hypothetical protein
MKHAIEESTRKAVRSIITMIRERHNVNKEKAEELFCDAISESEVVNSILFDTDDNIEEQRIKLCGA